MVIGGSALEALTEQLQEQLQNYNGGARRPRQQRSRQLSQQSQQRQQYQGGQEELYGGQQQIAGNVKVYTGPKQGKFIINKHGKKVYIDRKTLNNNVPYLKKKVKAKAAKK
jgi:hypothetical protein